MSTLYENIKTLCEERNIKGGKMCVDLGLSKSLMTDLKAERKKTITLETAQKIADYFGVPVDRILGEKKDPSGEGFDLSNYLDTLTDAQLLELLQMLTAKLAERRKDG